MDGVFDQFCCLRSRCRTLGCKITNFLSHNGKSLAGLSCSCGLNSCIQCQNIRLKCNIVDDLDDLGDTLRGIVDFLHSGHQILHLYIALFHILQCFCHKR